MRLNDILINERRAGGELNPKESAYEQLKRYKDDPDIYISFTEVDKIGINPRSHYNTPLGVYTYPLKIIWEGFDHEKGRIRVPFAGSKPYIYVVRATSPVQNVTDYDNTQMERDIKKASGIVYNDMMETNDDEMSVTERVDTAVRLGESEAEVSYPFVIMWNTTRILAKLYEAKDMVKWNYILRRLGYNAFVDPGEGFIHGGEPTQAVFLTATAFKSVDKISNMASKGMSDRRVQGLINYVYHLVIDDKPVPSNIMDMVLANPKAYNQIARVYSVQKAEPVPDDIVDVILNGVYASNDSIIELFTNWSSRKDVPFNPRMIKYLETHYSTLKLITNRIMEYDSHFPPEMVDAVMKSGKELIMHVALELIGKNRWPPKKIHDKLMSLGENSAILRLYKREMASQGMEPEYYRED